MNVMLTCAGRRNYLVQYFREALGNRGQVFAADASPDAPALQEAHEGFLLPLVSEPNYFDDLLVLCQEREVRLLVPLNDLELPLLARERDRFLEIGTLPVVSSPAVIDTCFDKWFTSQFLENSGILSPRSYLSIPEALQDIGRGIVAYPLVVKPRWGSASIGIQYAEDDDELESAYFSAKKSIFRTILADVSSVDIDRSVLIQEKIAGQEYGIDILNELGGRYVTTFVKKKLAMRAGETDRAITVADEELEELGGQIGRTLGHAGNLDCDVILGEDGFRVLELNPRLGGGYPFSHVAGANVPAALVAWANGEEPDEKWLTARENVASSKYDSLVMIRELSG
jgi:carbamoyl-phosphate synthase large subunit